MKNQLAIFEDHPIRRVYDEKTETWWFSVVDIVQVLTQQPDYQTARNCWKVLKNRLHKEGGQSVTKCNRLKLQATDGKSYLTDVATAETLLRLVQSVPSPKAETIKFWLVQPIKTPKIFERQEWLAKARRQAKSVGMKRRDVGEAIREVRKRK